MGPSKRRLFELNNEFQSFYSYIKSNKLFCVVIFFVALFAYGFPLTHFTLSIDEENALFRIGDAITVWSMQGRFGISILKTLFFSGQTNSITSTFLSVSALSLTSLIWAYALSSLDADKNKMKFDFGGLTVAVLFLSFPAHSENIGFSIMSFELGIGWVFISIATLLVAKWAILRKDNCYIAVGILLLILAISIYQAYLPVFICGVILLTLINLISLSKVNTNVIFKEYLIVILKYILVTVISLIVYKIIDTVISLYIPRSNYVEGFFVWGKENPSIIIRGLINNFKGLIMGDVIYGSNIILPSMIVCFLLLFLFIYKALIRTEVRRTAWLIVILFLSFVVSPFLMSVLLGSAMPIRANFVLALFISASWYLLYKIIDIKKLKIVFIVCTIIAVFYQSQSMAQLFYSDYNRYEEDVKIANQISYRIMDLDLGETPPYPVVYLGKHEQKKRANVIKQEVLGFSFFEWDGGNNNRIGKFMSSLGYEYKIPTEIEREKATKLAESMPVWPYKGSVALVDDLIIVNLSDNPEKYGLNLINDENKSMSQYKKTESVKLDKDNIDFFSDLVIENAESDSYILKAGDIDPYISISLAEKLEKDSFEHISFTIESNVEGDMQLFLLQENESYSEKYSGVIKLKKGMNKIICERQQFMNNLISLRIDPPALSVIKIKEISFFK
ncbi:MULTISPECIES: glucosyltransferase domain-containing protein [Paenibacillus]|uniref:glucosyltransferase domain-containing protein n=1 Tax=Paenibacillus TaxID=44249 RepID=UPI00096E178A|nr:glucosyltransferase domain-containing protein [Paenibacillus odorifer]OME47752.1 hypothetical protein BSK61_26155 [Paenibacillus odorifer]